jgi:glycosyltransferase involved in cell wall biosynthesis
MRIAFVWESLRKYYGTRFNDGLYLALKRLEERHTIGYFEPFDDEQIKEFKPDVILFWGALCGYETPHVKELPGKKAICFAGGPITSNNVNGFDLYFTESKINEDEFAAFGKPYLRAFGINEQIFKPMKVEKKYDAAIWASFALWKRHNLFADAVGETGLAIGQFQDHEKQCYEWCQAKGMDVRAEMPKEEMVPLLNEAHVALNTSDFWGGGQRMTLEAMAMNIPVIVMADSPKNREYVEECGLGLVSVPDPRHIRDAIQSLKTTATDWNTRGYIESKWTSEHYAKNLEKGLIQL